MNPRPDRRAGFTLLEIIIYMALFSLTVGGLLLTLYAVIDGSAKLQGRARASDEGIFLLRKLDWALMGVTSTVSAPSSSTLQITKPGLLPATDNPLLFALQSGNLTLKRGSTGIPVVLNSSGTLVSFLYFTYSATSGTVETSIIVTDIAQKQSFSATSTRYIRR